LEEALLDARSRGFWADIKFVPHWWRKKAMSAWEQVVEIPV
jgi:hypothetical protein